MSLLLPIQLLLLVFVIFAASRAVLRFQGGSIHFGGLLFWLTIWSGALLAIFFPDKTSELARLAGIGRGADVVIYLSLALLFYLVFRLHVYLEDVRTQVSELIRRDALADVKQPRTKKRS